MRLPKPTVRKLIRESFTGQTGIPINLNDRVGVMKEWTKKLERIDGIRITSHPGDRDSRSRCLIRFTIPNPSDQPYYWRSNELRLETDQEARLLINASDYPVDQQLVSPVANIDEIETFVRGVLARYASRNAKAEKREKIRQFKTKAILAQVKLLAKEEGFQYATMHDTQKLKLFIHLSGNHLIEFSIPFSKFQQTLPQLRDHLQTMRALYHDGLRFRVGTTKLLPHRCEWTNPET